MKLMALHHNLRRCLHAFLATVAIAVCTPAGAGESTSGFLVQNPWLDDSPGGAGWTFNSPWAFEPNVSSGTALFVTSPSNPLGTYAAKASTVDLTSESNVLALSGYDPSTTKLTGLTFSDPWRVGHFGTVPQDGDYDFYVDFTLETPGGSYRASSQKLDRAAVFQNTSTPLGLSFTWQNGGFLGDPFAGGSGVALDQITNMRYDVVVYVNTPTTTVDQFGNTGFFNAEGFNVGYEVVSRHGLPPDLNAARDDQINRQRDYIVDSIMPSGLVRDSLVLDGASFHPASPDAAGFALVGLAALDHLGKLPDAEQKVIDVLKAHVGQTPGVVPARSPEGHFTHYMNIATGAPAGGDWDPSYNTIGTALLVAGAQFAKNHFVNSPEIASLTTQLTDSVDFNAAIDPDLSGRVYRDMTAGGGGTPGVGNTPWNEYMLVVSLALRQENNDRALAIRDLWLDPDNLPTRSYVGNETITDDPNKFAPAFWTQQQYFFNGDFRHNPEFVAYNENLRASDQLYSTGEFSLNEEFRYGLTAGPSPQGYHDDRIGDHPNNVFSPEAVAAWGDMDTFLQFYAGQFPTSDPRYRYGALRESATLPDWVPFDVGLVDHLFLLFGLVESIDPDFFDDRVIPAWREFGADFDGDGDVDQEDLSRWETDFLNNGGSDADGDGDTDLLDLLGWQRQYGSGVSAGAVVSVPEPGNVLLALAALSLVCGRWHL